MLSPKMNSMEWHSRKLGGGGLGWGGGVKKSNIPFQNPLQNMFLLYFNYSHQIPAFPFFKLFACIEIFSLYRFLQVIYLLQGLFNWATNEACLRTPVPSRSLYEATQIPHSSMISPNPPSFPLCNAGRSFHKDISSTCKNNSKHQNSQ